MPAPAAPNESLFPSPPSATVLLTEDAIQRMVDRGELLVKNTFDQTCLQAASYDVRVGSKAVVGGQGHEIDLTKEQLVILPGAYAGALSYEKIKLPNNVIATIGTKRKFSYEGLILLSGSTIDPGYEGHLLFGLYNASSKKVVLPHRSKICSIVFYLLGTEQNTV